MAGERLHPASPQDFVLEELPQGVLETMAARDAWFDSLPRTSAGEEFLVSDVQAWRPGQVLRVAFLGGTSDLHRDIAEATEQITQACSIRFDFGFDPATGRYREWSTSDDHYAAEIRVSFDQRGNWSLVGTDCQDSSIGRATDAAGGRPNQRSLNLGGFDVRRPPGWKGTTRHEFMHAIAFRHEHQNLQGPCQHDFRWEDDAGYVPTQDTRGTFVIDGEGRRPGIYTYLSGAPNQWNRQKVDHNLRAEGNEGNTAGAFDAASVMLYRFPALFYQSADSACAPTTDGQDLSAGDVQGLLLLYPATHAAAPAGVGRSVELAALIESELGAGPMGLETMPTSGHRVAAACLRTLRTLRGLPARI